MADTPCSNSPSRTSTPNPRFTSRNIDDEDLLKEQTVGLVHLSDFKKKRLGIEESRDGTPATSGASTPDGRELSAKPAFKKRKKIAKKGGGLSFGGEEDEEGEQAGLPKQTKSNEPTNESPAPATDSEDASTAVPKKRLTPNSTVDFQPKVTTKTGLLREAQLKEQLRKEYALLQEAVKETDFCLPFVFFAGKNTPGGVCRMKKGDAIWLFLERARKVGADMAAKGDNSKRDWARISVDDLMLVRGDLIVPHHYDFHHFILNNSTGYNNKPLFSYSAEPTAATPKALLPSSNKMTSGTSTPVAADSTPAHLTTHAELAQQRQVANETRIPDSELEGFNDDPGATKVVDRRWYERNKHIYPASLWEDFDPAKDYSQGPRKDGLGNAIFFSR